MNEDKTTTAYQMRLRDLLRRMEKSTVGTFTPLWREYCGTKGDDDPKQFERDAKTFFEN